MSGFMRPLWLSLLALGCATTPTPAPEQAPSDTDEEPMPAAEPVAPPELQVLDAEAEMTFADDATLTIPAGWSAATSDDQSMLFAAVPEGDLQLVFLSRPIPLERGPGLAARLVTEAWRSIDPTFDLPVLQAVPAQSSSGWDAAGQVIFETPPSQGRAVAAVFQVKGERAIVALMEGSVDGFSRRGAQLNQLIGSVRVPGVEELNWLALERRTIDEAAITRLAERIEAERARAGVPGAAVVLVNSEEVLMARGFGTRSHGGAEEVTAGTRFMIGSTTKALTTLLAAKLVDEGDVRWDQPLSELLPEFRLADEDATAAITLERSFCACTGLPRRDLEFLFEFANASPETTLAQLATVSPTTAMGETFQYSNFLVAAGGYALGRAKNRRRDLDAAYGRALDREILRPLGMRSTTLDSRRARRAEHALPSARGIDGEVRLLDPTVEQFVSALEPAGAAWSTAEDMGRYLQMELREGALPDGRLMGEEALLHRREPGVAIGPDVHYGLGLIVGERAKVAHVGHDGNTIGFTSSMIFFPELDLGLAILTNLGSANEFTGAVDRMVMEMALPIDERAEAIGEQQRQTRTAALAQIAERLTDPTDAERDAILGRYESDELGPLEVKVEGERIVIDAGEWSSAIRVVQAGGERQWIITEPPLTSLPIRQEGERLTIAMPQHEYVFTRTEDD